MESLRTAACTAFSSCYFKSFRDQHKTILLIILICNKWLLHANGKYKRMLSFEGIVFWVVTLCSDVLEYLFESSLP